MSFNEVQRRSIWKRGEVLQIYREKKKDMIMKE
jgi:hypothetical protein